MKTGKKERKVNTRTETEQELGPSGVKTGG
jgi:hypothetical protein